MQAEKLLDHDSLIPLYHQLKEMIQETIASGTWQSEEKIPSEIELQKELKLSRNTVKKAFDDLVQEGVLYRIQGKGTFVSKPKFEQSLSGFYSFSKVMEKRGYSPKDFVLGLELKEGKPSVTNKLQLPEETAVIELKRLRCAQGEPVILETSYIPQRLVPELSKDDLEKNSLYDVMQSRYGIAVTKAKEIFEPVLVRDYESKYLQVQEGSPALLLERIAYHSNGEPVEFCHSIVRGDKCRFYTELL